MTPAARERLQVRVALLLLSAAAWTLLVIQSVGAAPPTHHTASMPDMGSMSDMEPMSDMGSMPGMASVTGEMRPASLGALLAHNSPASLALSWALMLVAMMLPLLSTPVRHVRQRTFAYRRARSILLFAAGYAAVWMAAGVVLLTLSLVAQLFPVASWLAVASVIVIAVVWQFSPAKQRCLNRGHAHPELAAFGAAGDVAALRFGFTHAVWCVGSCWALMLVSLLIPHGQVAVMAAVTLWLVAERLDRPTSPRWGIRGPSKAARLAIAQTRILLQRV